MKKLLAPLLALICLSIACQAVVSPTATPAPTRVPPTSTNTPRPTPNHTATAETRATQEAAEIAELVGEELAFLGLSPEVGALAWQQEGAIEMTADEPRQAMYLPLSPNPDLTDFVLSYDVTWDSETGVAGCGSLFRSGPNFARDEQAYFFTYRLSGFPAWDVFLYKFGQYQTDLTGTSDWELSSAIHQASDSTNHYLFYMHGLTVEVYGNGERLGVGTLPARLTHGQFAFTIYQESGFTTCTFENGWIWDVTAEN